MCYKTGATCYSTFSLERVVTVGAGWEEVAVPRVRWQCVAMQTARIPCELFVVSID